MGNISSKEFMVYVYSSRAAQKLKLNKIEREEEERRMRFRDGREQRKFVKEKRKTKFVPIPLLNIE